MRKIFALTKAFLKNSYQKSFGLHGQSNANSTGKKMITILLMLMLLLYLAGIFGFLSFGIITSLIVIHQESMFIGIFLLAIALLTLFQTIFTSINVLYFSKDVEHVLPFPIKPWQLLVAKFNSLLITEYITELLFGLVPLLLYGVLTGAGILYYLYAVMVLLLFPILPVLLVCFIIMLIMSFSKRIYNRDRFQLFATFLSLAIVFGCQFFLMQNGDNLTEDQLFEMLQKSNSIVGTISHYFPTIEPSVEALTNPSVGYATLGVVKLIGITAISYLAFILVGQKLYLRGAIGNLSGRC